jgi:hypothetical protein
MLTKASLPFSVFTHPVHELGLGIGPSKSLYVSAQDNINAHKTQRPDGKRPLGRPRSMGRTFSSVVSRGRAGRADHDQRRCYHHAPTVKPEAATAIVELPMMGVRTPETY